MKKSLKKIAWIQCVGSRDTNRCSNEYCSSVCCMYAIKQALVTKEHLPLGSKIKQSIFYMDIRTHGKEFEKYFEDAKVKGVEFVRARPHTLEPGPDNRGVILRYVDENGEVVKEEYDLVVLSIGLESPESAKDLSNTMEFDLDEYNFAKTSSFNLVQTSKKRHICDRCIFRSKGHSPGSYRGIHCSCRGSKAFIKCQGYPYQGKGVSRRERYIRRRTQDRSVCLFLWYKHIKCCRC